jgi:transposase
MQVSGLDIDKDSIFCSIYDGKIYGEVKEFSTRTESLRQMGRYLQEAGVKQIAMESTGIYWIPVWDLLAEMGFDLLLVNPYQIKQMPGRKSDVKDAQWIATLLSKGMLKRSMVPNATIKELRIYTRKYSRLVQQTNRILTKMDTVMVTANIRISSWVSDLSNKSVIRVIDALIAGETDADNLSKLVYGNTANKQSGKLREALTGNVKEHHIRSLKWAKEEYDLYQRQIQECLDYMETICNEHYAKEMKLLQSLPGISKLSAMSIIAETGGDMSIFENSGKIAGWAGLRPRNDESAGKFKSKAITKGNKYLRSILVQVAWSAVRTKGSFFKEKYSRLALRKSNKKAIIAIARKLLVISWNVLKEENPYNPTLVHIYDPVKVARSIAYHQKEIERATKLLSNKDVVLTA